MHEGLDITPAEVTADDALAQTTMLKDERNSPPAGIADEPPVLSKEAQNKITDAAVVSLPATEDNQGNTKSIRSIDRRDGPTPLPSSYRPHYDYQFEDAFFDEGIEKEPPPPDGPYVKYQHIYQNSRLRDILYTATAYEPFTAEEEVEAEAEAEERCSVFDVIRTFQSLRYYSGRFRPKFKRAPRSRNDPEHSIIIRSAVIIRALQGIVTYYPDLNLSTETLTIDAPYRLLVYYYPKLRELWKKCRPGENTEGVNESNALETKDMVETYQHLGLLLEFLDREIMPSVRAEQKRNENGVCTFQWMWIMFKPGTDVAMNNFDIGYKGGMVNRNGAVVSGLFGGPNSRFFVGSGAKRLRFGRANGDESDEEVLLTFINGQHVPAWRLKIWSMNFDGKWVGRLSGDIYISAFDGEMDIARLEVMPVDMAKPVDDGTPLRQYLEDQGRKWYSCLKPVCQYHSGEVMIFPFHELEGLIMVDAPTYFDKPELRIVLDSAGAKDPPSKVSPAPSCGNCGFCSLCIQQHGLPTSGNVAFSSYDEIRPETVKELKPHQYFLCPQVIQGYFFKSRTWETVDVRNLSVPQWKTGMMDTLALEDKPISFLKSLAQGFMRYDTDDSLPPRQQLNFTADFVKGKGNAKIFLLHGQPGVGKTYTAECIAEYTRRPLLELSCADIGTTPKDVDANLEDNFMLAKKWGAILLIDEADVYLERREKTDLERNSLVAGFLRALEVYDGILFLTTNRVGTFDDAFISRIHVKLYYPPLRKHNRKRVWGNFIKKLRDECGDKVKITDDVEDYLESDKMLDIPFNGREIRNIFQTAVSLAEFEHDLDKRGKIQLKKQHITQVVEFSDEFKKYLDGVWAMDEGERAEKTYTRRDVLDSPKP